MISLPRWAQFAAVGIAATLVTQSQAEAHAVCGNRVFPATLAIDDPGVSDELALPTMTFLPKNSDGVQEVDASFSYTKTITENLGISISDGPTWLKPGGLGWGNIGTELKYKIGCDAPHEFMASFGLQVSWASTGTKRFSDPFNTFTPVIDIGKGFGDLPTSLNLLRPIALTAQFSLSVPGARHTSSLGFDDSGNPIVNVGLNPTVFNWGFTLQYSLPYMNANVSEVGGPDFLKHLVPITEFAFQTPVANVPQGGRVTTGTVQPGVIYMADTWQLAVEALIPINKASGRHVGVVAELHFYLDDIFPNTLGKPIFSGH
jgi:hypothetical protein